VMLQGRDLRRLQGQDLRQARQRADVFQDPLAASIQP